MKRSSVFRSGGTSTLALSGLMLAMISPLGAQNDPGPRLGPPGAGSPVTGLTPTEAALFASGMAD